MNITDTTINATVDAQQEYQSNNTTQLQNDTGALSFKSHLQELLAQNNIILGAAEQNILLNTANTNSIEELNSSKILNWAKDLNDIKSSFNYNTMTMDKDDAIFFASLTENIPAQVSIANNEINTLLDSVSETENLSKTTKVSKTLANIIENCMRTQQSARIDFDNNISVILKIDQKGKVSAEFIPSDKIAEQYLKNNIAFLRQSFDEQNLPYNELTYRQNKGNNSSNNNNKDKEHE